MDLDAFLARAHPALQYVSLRWPGHGSRRLCQNAPDLPATAFDITSTLPRLACTCSGCVCRALGIPFNGWPEADDGCNTDRMLAEAAGSQRGFVLRTAFA